jgi:methionine sulfoxide reductase catalytic subunit
VLILKPSDIPSSQITPKEQYLNRRRFLGGVVAGAATLLGAAGIAEMIAPRHRVFAGTKLQTVKSPLTTTGEDLTSYQDLTTYNNYYEFGVDKGDPSKNAGKLPVRPWTMRVEGLVAKPKTFDIDELLKLKPLEDRVYRHRCVEAWSMVIPWVGYSLSEFIKQCEPLAKAQYVQFLSYYDAKVEPWTRESAIEWPYSEGLRMDEAMNPLALLTFGLYGETLPNQNGAPIRIVVPWKYGFKSAKSIVAVRFVEKEPHTTWNDQNSQEYGFYSNVNPQVDHPRWSQAHERLLNSNSIFPKTVPTLMFNGYNEVASMYAGMDLRKNY